MNFLADHFLRTITALATILLLAGGMFTADANPQRGIPDNLLMFGGYGDAALVVDKEECSVSVYRKADFWELESNVRSATIIRSIHGNRWTFTRWLHLRMG